MKTIIIPKASMSYPVGENIKGANNFIMNGLYALKEYDKETNVLSKLVVIWCRGSSGAILSALLALELSKLGTTVSINHIKKQGESAHHYNDEYKYYPNAFNIILDDFIDSGRTVNNIHQAILRINKDEPVKFTLIVNGINMMIRSIPLFESVECVITEQRGIDNFFSAHNTIRK